MKKISKQEKFLIATVDIEKYNTYQCDEHGIFQKVKGVDDGCCLYCKKKCKPLEAMEELKEKYENELGLK